MCLAIVNYLREFLNEQFFLRKFFMLLHLICLTFQKQVYFFLWILLINWIWKSIEVRYWSKVSKMPVLHNVSMSRLDQIANTATQTDYFHHSTTSLRATFGSLGMEYLKNIFEYPCYMFLSRSSLYMSVFMYLKSNTRRCFFLEQFSKRFLVNWIWDRVSYFNEMNIRCCLVFGWSKYLISKIMLLHKILTYD